MRRFSVIVLGIVLGIAGVSSAVEAARMHLEHGLGRLTGSPVRVRRLTFSPSRLTLHHVSLETKSFLDFAQQKEAPGLRIECVDVQGSIVSLAASLLWRDARKGPLHNGEFIQSVALTGLKLSVAGVPLNAQGKLYVEPVPGQVGRCTGTLTIEHPFLRGEVELSGPVTEPVVLGWLEGPRAFRRNFIGQLRLSAEGAYLSRMEVEGGWTATGGFRRERALWKAVLDCTGPDGRYQLKANALPHGAWRLNLLVSYEGRPPMELDAAWQVRRSRLEFRAEALSEQVRLQGHVQTRAPHTMEAKLELRNAPIAEIGMWLLPPGKMPRLDGRVNGSVSFSGPARRVKSRGEVVGRKARFNREVFDLVALRFRGFGPVLHVHNSQLMKQNLTLLMDGRLDLRQLGQNSFFSGIQLSPVDRDPG